MNKHKATFVVAMMAVMLTAIMMLLLLSGAKVMFFILVGLLAALGMVYGIAMMLSWLTDDDKDEADLDPVEVHRDPEDAPVIDTMTYDEIKREIEKEIGGDEA